ncbi:L-serine ammonia-lyase [Nesterenkonia populi]
MSAMQVSLFDLFRVGIGPSSSHTVGPMRAARRFVAEELAASGTAGRAVRLEVDLFGSLAATGAGHGTFPAVLLGLEGWDPEELLPAQAEERTAEMQAAGLIRFAEQLGFGQPVPLRAEDFTLRPLTVLERHTNAMRMKAFDAEDMLLAENTYYSVGGGFVVAESDEAGVSADEEAPAPYPFSSPEELMAHCGQTGLPISQIMLANEAVRQTEDEVREGIWRIWTVMEDCRSSALSRTGPLPGGLNVRRRAPGWHARLSAQDSEHSYAYWQEWVNLTALAVNEENASGGRVVTAPTNGAAGIIPAVGFYAAHYGPGASFARVQDRRAIVTAYLLTAAAVGVLYKEQASISGAEVGCQGEVGSASSMAAAGLCEVLGGTAAQVENAAEIAMEHSLGLTCDPIGGLVQVPCIERNAIAAGKAVNAARMALMGDGEHRVSLSEVIATMRETGKDMSHKYKETALGGLAVNVVEC